MPTNSFCVFRTPNARLRRWLIAAPSRARSLPEQCRRRKLAVVPALINCHEHLSYKARRGSIAEMMTVPDATLALQAAESARWDISQGITSVRSTGDKNFIDVAMSRAIASGIAGGPRVIAAGPPLLMSGGHGYPIGWECDGPDSFRAAARKLFKNGSDFVKLMASGGTLATLCRGDQIDR